jgi:hypothetical protein
VARCDSGEPAMMCEGTGQHQNGRISLRPRDDGGAADLARGTSGASGEKSLVAAGDSSLLLHHRERERNMRRRLIERHSGRRMGLTGEGCGRPHFVPPLTRRTDSSHRSWSNGHG